MDLKRFLILKLSNSKKFLKIFELYRVFLISTAYVGDYVMKIWIRVVLVLVLMVSGSVLGAVTSSTRVGYVGNAAVYWVSLRNNVNRVVYCTLTATNGARYDVIIGAYGSSRWLRINDRHARYVYMCRF